MDARSEQVREVQELFLRYSDQIRGMARALVRQRDLVDDVLQETFLVVSAKAGDFTRLVKLFTGRATAMTPSDCRTSGGRVYS